MRLISKAWSALMSGRFPWPRLQIVVSLHKDRIAATATRGGVAVWNLEGPDTDDLGGHAAAMAALLSNIPRTRRIQLRPELVIEVGSDLVQVKRLFGLPSGADLRSATVIVRESATRFFRATSTRLMTSTVREHSDGSRWAAAYRAEIISEVARACEQAGVTLRAIVPQAALAGPLGRESGRDLCAPVGRTGESALPPGERRLLAVAGLIGITLLATVPMAVAHNTARAAAAAHAILDSDERVALRAAEELRRVSEVLTDLSDRRGDRRSMIDLLGSITTALPEGAVLTQLRVDTIGGALIVLAQGTDAVLTGLGASTGMVGLEIVGPVTRERVGGRELERINLKFRHARSGAPGTEQ